MDICFLPQTLPSAPIAMFPAPAMATICHGLALPALLFVEMVGSCWQNNAMMPTLSLMMVVQTFAKWKITLSVKMSLVPAPSSPISQATKRRQKELGATP